MIILVAFAHSLSRDYARFHLAHHDPQIEVATADSLESAIHRANAMPALDVVVLDMMMPDMDGLLGLRGFRQSCRHEVPIAVTSVSLNALTLRDILAAGGAGFLPFDMKPAALVSALRLIADGESFIPATLATELAHRADQPRLTRREHDMLSGLRAGLSNKEIADKLQLSEVTVKHHVKSLRGKLGARNWVHAICRAIELQIE